MQTWPEIEIWNDVLGFEGLYAVSNLGRVKSLSRKIERRGCGSITTLEFVMKISPHVGGYNHVRISKGGKSYLKRVSVLVCEAFHGPRPVGKQAAHRNGVRTDDRAGNLSWRTRKENELDKIRHGTRPFGEDVWNAKLTNCQVVHIRRLRRGGLSYGQIQKKLDVPYDCVRNVITGRTYTTVLEAA